jgi:GTPase SAR1 family protein
VSQSGEPQAAHPTLAECLTQLAALAAELDRADLAAALTTDLHRLESPDTVIAVVGEFKEGKSSLINALLGHELSPVDDDVSTAAIAWFHYLDSAQTRVHLREEGVRKIEEITTEQVGNYLTETGNSTNTLGVELVEFGLPNPVLKAGLSFLDTPGTDGIDGPVGQAVLNYLRSAHGLIFVTDASAELNAVELQFLREAIGKCPGIVVALTKIDLYPEWRRILDINRRHLARIGDIPVAAVSSQLRVEGLTRTDADLNTASGIPDLMILLRTRVIDDVSKSSSERARAEADNAARMLLAGLRSQRDALTNVAEAETSLEKMKTARDRLEKIRKVGSRWSTLLSDGITDLSQTVDVQVRLGFRQLLEDADETLGTHDPAAIWDDYVHSTRQAVTDLSVDLARHVNEATRDLAVEVTRQLGDDEGVLSAVIDMDRAVEIEGAALRAPETRYNPFAAILTGMRGASSGVILLGMIGRLAGLALATPVSIGVGVLFAAKQVIEERKRLVDRRRQEARSEARRFLSQAQTDLSVAIRELIRDEQRALRDAVTERLNQLNQTYATTIHSIEAALGEAEQQRQSRLPIVEAQIRRLEGLEQAIGALA